MRGLALALAVIAASAGFVASGPAAGARAATCHHERGPFHARGTAVIGSTGRYIPYGITVTGLAHQDWPDLTTSFRAELRSTDNAPVSAPRFLSYLRVHRFGLIVTQMVKYQLIESANLNDPTHFRGNWACRTGLNQGVGLQAQQWFIRRNS